jgi:alpha-D-xyloside xylohydrolase
VIERVKGEREAVVFARSATVGGQRFPVHWGGDCDSTYLSMAESLRGGLSLCMSGFGFWSHDISGFGGTATADLYKRWTAFGLLSTHSRLHGSNSYRVPWLFSEEGEENGEESVAVLRHFSELKCRLMPYLFASAVYTHNTGIPSMRAMVLEFPEDICCEDLDRQYMLGERLLVAPVFNKEGDVTYYLPEGEWTHLLSGEVKQGGKWIRERYDYFSLPLFVRENTILPIGGNDQAPDYDYTDGLTLQIYSLKDTAEAIVYDTDGQEALRATAIRNGDAVTLSIRGQFRELKLRLVNVNAVTNVTGARIEYTERDVVLHVEKDEISFHI